ncbi:MAG: (d)CMP kinase [Pelagibacteraceae bacterium]|jgi:shikimate kinase|nr:(d)CMP kinase [Pelagibacteraceae bacterium]HJO13506.1 shikimate kinase [Alphaproteobacteria bacterium]MBO6466837.1 (d)CMP kinase [Pelagibacteraceae bacterium]MBO6467149.1 (d)CMP kinase [Pelagibacteraceae bacterium]MBO6470061.1 (d)CMP kinase [Pelagibacteraceae bacterium]
MESLEFKNKLEELKKNNIAIIGHMGAGKSIVAKTLAKKIDFKHIDSDYEITRFAMKSINKIFQEKGEEYFRNIETEIVLKLIEKKNVILSLGGGTILSGLIRDKLKKNSITLFLDVSLLELEKRLKKSTKRPLLKNVDIAEKVKELDIVRRKYYLLSDITIKNTNSPIDTCKNFIKKFAYFHEKTNINKNKKQKM